MTIDRPTAVSRMRRRLLATSSPRAHVLVALALAGCSAFLFSALTLSFGLQRMVWRYPLSALAGYFVFLLMIRVWIAWQRRALPDDAPIDWLSQGPSDGELFAGGRSGSAGGGADWGSSGDAVPDAVDVDPSDLWPVLLVIAAAVAGAFALVYAVYIAPVLLAEVMVDAVLVTTVYRRLRREDQRHWTVSVFAHTRVPMVCLVLLLAVAGWALERFAPGARSVGDVLRTLSCS